MQLCANENIPPTAIGRRRDGGHDVLAVKESMPGSPDTAVLARAVAEKRIIVRGHKGVILIIDRRCRPRHRRAGAAAGKSG